MYNNLLEIEFQKAKVVPSDINEHLEILNNLAKDCNSIVEIGVGFGRSTLAFLNSNARLRSFDIVPREEAIRLFKIATSQGKDAVLSSESSLTIEIPEVDLLFIDSYHVYLQVAEELRLHGNKAKKYIALHDTHTFGLRGEDGKDNKGLLPAIIEFMIDNPHWKFKTHRTNNNGLTILERTDLSLIKV